MRRAAFVLAAVAALWTGGPGWAQARIVDGGTTGLAAYARTGYLGEADRWDSVVIAVDQPSARVLFLWDDPRLALRVRVFLPPDGRMVGEYDLSKGNLMELPWAGTMELRIESVQGTGHWACLLLTRKEWDIR